MNNFIKIKLNHSQLNSLLADIMDRVGTPYSPLSAIVQELMIQVADKLDKERKKDKKTHTIKISPTEGMAFMQYYRDVELDDMSPQCLTAVVSIFELIDKQSKYNFFKL